MSKYCDNRKSIKTRIEKSKMQMGSKNSIWKGDDVGYYALHAWVKRNSTKSKSCNLCGKTTTRLDLANKGIYNRNLENWEWLCRRCHMLKDGRLEKFKKCNKPNNRYITFNGKTQILSEWSREIGIGVATLSRRLNKYKWSIKKTLTTKLYG